MQNKTDKSECVHDAHEFGTFDNVTGKCWVCGKTYSQVTGEGNAPRILTPEQADKFWIQHHKLSAPFKPEICFCPKCKTQLKA